MLPQAAVVTRDVLALEGGDPPPPPRLAVMMDTIVDGSIAIVLHQETIMTAHQQDTNRPATSRMENGMGAVSVAVVANEVVGDKSHAETIEVRLDHAREARTRKTTAARIHHQTFVLLPKTSVAPRR